MLKHTTTIRVRYADTDKMQFVYNGKYLEYFEVGRTELLRSMGLPYSEIEKGGHQLPLIEANLKYKKPAVYDDLLDVEASVSSPYSAKVHIEYRITHHETKELICEGYTSHVFINADSKRPTRPPKVYVEKVSKYFTKK
ncbi:MAG: acyl-CoA thioesterase [Melioribacteraceae bacterium]|nr:acyl-CoA thioesterase [Melioribacteraceae bacterium]